MILDLQWVRIKTGGTQMKISQIVTLQTFLILSVMRSDYQVLGKALLRYFVLAYYYSPLSWSRGIYFYQKLKIFRDALKKISEIFNHKNWIYLVIFLNLWVFGFSKVKTFLKMDQISKLFRDDYHWINRNIHPYPEVGQWLTVFPSILVICRGLFNK